MGKTTIFFDYNISRQLQIVIRGKEIASSKVYPNNIGVKVWIGLY